MLAAIRWVFWAAVRVLLWLRYWITIRGREEALQHPGPYLIIPNHPAYIEPPNLLIRLWPTFRMRPLLLETNFKSPLLAPFAWLIEGIRVPDTERASAEARARAEAAVQAAIDTLRAGRNVIIWASGRLMRDGTEHVGGARTVADVLAAVPNVTVVLVRTRGMWGSMFSWAWRTKPSLGGGLWRGFWMLLANLIVFAPRRHVAMTLEAFEADKRPEPTREKINPWLEEWFNRDVHAEKPTFVPYHFAFGPRQKDFPPPLAADSADLSRVKPAIKQAVAEIVQEKLKRPLSDEEQGVETTFMQLGLDSLDTMEILLQVEQRFGFSSDTVPVNLGQLWALAAGLLENAVAVKPAPPAWFALDIDESPPDVRAATIPAAILDQAFAHLKQVIVADDLAGALSYERLLVGAWAMSRRFRDLQGEKVGLMLPASVASDLAFVALHLAGKVPVLLNWTTGPGNLAHAAKVMSLCHVITSRAFIDRTEVVVEGTAYVFLEDVRKQIGRFQLLRRLIAVRWFPGYARKRLERRLSADREQAAVILFTSGSEKAPKAVPLTHENILSIPRAVLAEFNLKRGDSILGFLPMFHSFGLVVTSVLPLVTGIRVVHHPDPTDAASLARKAGAYKPTLVAATPTFLGYILDRARPDQLQSLRLVVLGAEKCPAAVFDKVRKLVPAANVAEGYGITECSAVVSVHRPGAFKEDTLGPPLQGVSVCVLDLESESVLPAGKMGMLHVSGPNVFPGYLQYDGPSPFKMIDGKRWYITGDLGELNPEGEVVFRGRLKRFLKAGGEMISLPALEEPFARLFPATDIGPRAAVEGIETPEGRRIVLFTTEDLDLREANSLLQKEGFRGVLRLDEVCKVDKLPVLGSGKTDYKVLRAMIS